MSAWKQPAPTCRSLLTYAIQLHYMDLIDATNQALQTLAATNFDANSLSQSEAEEQVHRLRTLIRQHNHRYYIKDDPVITDPEYDRLYRTLEDLERAFPALQSADSPTQRVGGEPIDAFEKHEHPEPLLSLSNAFDASELREWYDRCRRGLSDTYGDVTPCLVAELKIDGLAVALTYEGGRLAVAATRGNGRIGENITHNVRTIHRIPMVIPVEGDAIPPEQMEVRGEIFMRKSEFDALNERLRQSDEQPFANPRNAAAGTIRQLDPSVTAQRPLSFFAYSTGPSSGELPNSHYQTLEVLGHLGLPLESHTQRSDSIDEIADFCESWAEQRDRLDYEIDGVVVKIDNFEYQEELGAIANAPRWAVAFKFPAREATTTLEKIVVNVGRTGAIKPEAVLTPVQIGGVTVSQATLHNEDYIADRDIREADTVVVKRAGDVIPQVVRPVMDARKGDEEPWTFPTTCPECGTELVRLDDEADWYCMNTECPAQFRRLVEHFVMRNAMDVEGLGERVAHMLVDEGIVETLADLFRLTTDDLIPLEGFAEKSAQNLIEALDAARDRPLSRLLFALGIRHVGRTVAETIVEHFETIDSIAETDVDTLTAIDGVGPVIAESLVDWFQVERNRDLIRDLQRVGVNTTRTPREAPVEEQDTGALPLAGKTLVITGSLDRLTRKDATSLIEEAGGKVTSSVSGNTDYLVKGDNPGSKYDDALERGIDVVDGEGALRNLVAKDGPIS